MTNPSKKRKAKMVPFSLRLTPELKEMVEAEMLKSGESEGETIRQLMMDGWKYRYEPAPIFSRKVQECNLAEAHRFYLNDDGTLTAYAEGIIKKLRERVKGSISIKAFLAFTLALIVLMAALLVAGRQVLF